MTTFRAGDRVLIAEPGAAPARGIIGEVNVIDGEEDYEIYLRPPTDPPTRWCACAWLRIDPDRPSWSVVT